MNHRCQNTCSVERSGLPSIPLAKFGSHTKRNTVVHLSQGPRPSHLGTSDRSSGPLTLTHTATTTSKKIPSLVSKNLEKKLSHFLVPQARAEFHRGWMPFFRFRCGRWSRYAENSSGSGRTWSLCTRTHSQNGLPGLAFSRKFRPQSHRTKIYSTQRSPFYFLIFFSFFTMAPLVPSVPFRPQLDRSRRSYSCQTPATPKRLILTAVLNLKTNGVFSDG